MKVLHILSDTKFGGIGALVITLVQQQLKAGDVSPSILFAAAIQGDMKDSFRLTGASLYSMNCRRGFDISMSKYKQVKSIFNDVDVLHFHYFNPFLAWCAIRCDKKIVYTEHGNFGFGRKKRFSDRIKRQLLKIFLNKYVHTITFNSEFSKIISQSRFDLAGANRLVIYNGTDPDSVPGEQKNIDPEIEGRLKSNFVVGTCSRFAGFKRIDRLIDAYSSFRQGKTDTVLLLVGDGDLRPELERMVAQLGLIDNVIFAGYRNNPHDYQNVMDLCVYPSENEPFGLVAVESLLLGKPVLVFKDGGGLNEIVAGLSGADIAAGPTELVDRMEHYYKIRNRIEEDSGERKQYARQFSADKMGCAFYEVYKKLA